MIREATVDDKFRLVEMTTRFIVSTRYHEWLGGTTPDRIGALVDRVLEHGVIFVAETDTPCMLEKDDGDGYVDDNDVCISCAELVGMLALIVFEHPLTGRPTAEEAAWWVEPEHRHGSVGPRLMAHMEGWCVQKRLHMVKMVAPDGSSVGDFYKKRGYQAVETHWVRVFD